MYIKHSENLNKTLIMIKKLLYELGTIILKTGVPEEY